MNKETFASFKKSLLTKASNIQNSKRTKYYSEEDVLKNLRKIANFRNTSTPAVAMDLLAKHLQSLSDMTDAEFPKEGILSTDPVPSLEDWEEKLMDSINYHFILYALIREAKGI